MAIRAAVLVSGFWFLVSLPLPSRSPRLIRPNARLDARQRRPCLGTEEIDVGLAEERLVGVVLERVAKVRQRLVQQFRSLDAIVCSVGGAFLRDSQRVL